MFPRHAGFTISRPADADILIDYRAADKGIPADADVWVITIEIILQLVYRLKIVRTHQNRVFDPHTRFDPATQPNNRISRVDAVQYAALADERLIDVAPL